MPQILLIHLELGLGGAERLVLDLCDGLIESGADVTIGTTYWDPDRCFDSCHNLRVIEHGRLIPRKVFDRFTVLLSFLRLLYLIVCLVVIGLWNRQSYDVVISDQLALFNPLLKLLFAKKLAYYCHFPDKLMVIPRDEPWPLGPFKNLYRRVFDALEAYGMEHADLIWVNSQFTKEKFLSVYGHLPSVADSNSSSEVADLKEPAGLSQSAELKKVSAANPVVLYPSVSTRFNASSLDSVLQNYELKKKRFFLSMNRYELKKNHKLALEAFNLFLKEKDTEEYKLVICGGFDPTLIENALVLRQLQSCIPLLGHIKPNQVLLLKSVSELERNCLMAGAAAVLYTPANEHFGIVPIESMSFGTPVIAVNSGGPKETILDGETGSLVSQSPDDFCKAMLHWAGADKHVFDACQKRSKEFSFNVFSQTLKSHLEQLGYDKKRQ